MKAANFCCDRSRYWAWALAWLLTWLLAWLLAWVIASGAAAETTPTNAISPTNGLSNVEQTTVTTAGVQDETPQVANRQELEKLSWMLGKWTTSPSVEIPAEASAQWSSDGNFLVLDYRVTPPGFPPISASDRIAWDPVGKSFRSWTFRGDGGFGQANWVARDGGWMIRYGGTHSDGRQFSSTLLLLKGNDGTMKLSAIERWVGDEQFPDLELELRQAEKQAAPSFSIENRTWELVRLESGPCRARNHPTLALRDREVQAFGGINQIGGEYQQTGDSLRFRNLISTLMGGSEAESEIEQEFSATLEKVTRFTIEDEQLVLWAEDKRVAWFKERQAEPASFDDVRNVTWELIELKGVAVESEPRPTLRFVDGNVEGHGGVNQMGGTFNQTADSLTFGPMRSTRRGGPQPAMELEAAYGQALATTTRFDLVDEHLLLLNGNDVVAKFRQQE
jgi:heat shock protein HslJ